MVHFYNIFVLQNLLKDETALKIPLFFSTSSYNSFSVFISLPALTVSFPVNKFPNKLAPKVPNNIHKNPPFVLLFHF